MGIKNGINTGVTVQSTPTAITRAGSANGLWPVIIRATQLNDFTLAAASGVQTAFSSTVDVITLEASTAYAVKGRYFMTTGTTTTKTTAIAFLAGGGLTITSMALAVRGYNAVANTTVTATNGLYMDRLASTVVTATATTGGVIIEFEGTIRINAGGTLTPQINFSANPGGTNLMKANSFIEFTPIGTNTSTSTSTAIG
jgi:hypothetical protein